MFWWAKFRKAKGGVKLHTLFDITTQIPAFIHITAATVNDMNAMDVIPYEPQAYYIFDRGYVDYQRLYHITQCQAFFVVRAKSNLKFRRMYSNKVDKSTGVLCDQLGKLTGFYVSKEYPEKLRRVKFYDQQTHRTFVFLTNNMELSAPEIALLYKNRWQVELFFKWIKQNLKIKTFLGTSHNAVLTQIWIALCVYLLLAFLKFKARLGISMQQMLRLLQLNLFERRNLIELFKPPDSQSLDCRQFLLFSKL